MQPIAVDAMGGDHAPNAIVRGVGLALDSLPGLGDIYLVGDEQVVRAELAHIGKLDHPKIKVTHAPDVVHMGEPATTPLRGKKKASIAVALDLVKDGQAAAVVSAGHTGATMACSVVKLRTLPGVDRPGIAAQFPSTTGRFVLLDAGATVDCKPEHLVQFAVMGDIYASSILKIVRPRIGVLSNGTEDEKGTELTKATFKLLQAVPGINFVGNVEGHDLFDGKVDVVVCDGFVGNIVLKACESLAKAMGSILKQRLKANPWRLAGAMMAYGALQEVRALGDAAEYGGAPFLGVNGIVIKAHGSSSPRAIQNAIRVAHEFLYLNINAEIVKRVAAATVSGAVH